MPIKMFAMKTKCIDFHDNREHHEKKKKISVHNGI